MLHFLSTTIQPKKKQYWINKEVRRWIDIKTKTKTKNQKQNKDENLDWRGGCHTFDDVSYLFFLRGTSEQSRRDQCDGSHVAPGIRRTKESLLVAANMSLICRHRLWQIDCFLFFVFCFWIRKLPSLSFGLSTLFLVLWVCSDYSVQHFRIFQNLFGVNLYIYINVVNKCKIAQQTKASNELKVNLDFSLFSYPSFQIKLIRGWKHWSEYYCRCIVQKIVPQKREKQVLYRAEGGGAEKWAVPPLCNLLFLSFSLSP